MTSRLQQMQQSFQKRQMQEKEKQLINMYTKNQQKALEKVSKSEKIVSNGVSAYNGGTKSYGNNVKRNSPGIDKSRLLAPLNTNGGDARRSFEPQKPRIKVTQPSAKASVLSDRQKAREAMKQKEAELLSKIKQQRAELDRVKYKKNNDLESENNQKNSFQSRTKPARSKPTPQFSENRQTERFKPSVSVPTKKKTVAPPRKVDPNLTECEICGRSFAKDRIDKHVTICKKTTGKKRKVFDVTKMRTKGTEAEKFVKRGMHKKPDPPKKSNWRKQHEEFMRSVSEAKKFSRHIAAGGKASDLPPPPPSENPDYVQCPHCERRFNEAAAERHIPKCQNILSNKKNPPKNQWNTSNRKPAGLANRIAARRR